MQFRTAIAIAFVSLTISARVEAATCERPAHNNSFPSCLQLVQFDDDADGVAGCVNKCKLDLEICLGLRPPDESRDRCDQLEDQCENGCYNTGPDAGNNNE